MFVVVILSLLWFWLWLVGVVCLGWIVLVVGWFGWCWVVIGLGGWDCFWLLLVFCGFGVRLLGFLVCLYLWLWCWRVWWSGVWLCCCWCICGLWWYRDRCCNVGSCWFVFGLILVVCCCWLVGDVNWCGFVGCLYCLIFCCRLFC